MRAFIGDEMVNNGNALFDNGQVRDGNLLHFEQHLDRMYKGAKNTKMIDTIPLSRDQIREVVVKTIGLSGCKDCAIRFFLAGGVQGKSSHFYIIGIYF